MNDIQFTTNFTENDEKRLSDPLEYNSKIDGFELKPYQSFSIMNEIIEKNLEFVDESNVVFISGCNLVVFDLHKKTSKFLIRKCPEFIITSLSVGFKSYTEDNKIDPYICLGEFNPVTRISQISTISVKNPTIQNILLKQNENEKNNSIYKDDILASQLDWNISSAQILTNSSYCLSISKKEHHGFVISKVAFWKFTQKKFISEVIFHENLNSASYNPQNSLELIICGKGYLRLWNVFINEGSLKEHPQRLLKSKTEKVHNFLKAEFFKNKSFVFIVGTKENLFYIIEGFQVIYEFNASYNNSITDLYINKINKTNDEQDMEIENLYSKEDNDTDDTPNFPFKSSKSNLYFNKKDSRITQTTQTEKNQLRNFYLISDSYVLIGFEYGSMTYIFSLADLIKHKKKESNEEEIEQGLENANCLRLMSNAKSIINIMTNPDKSRIIYMLEFSGDLRNKKRNIKNSQNENSICLLLFKREGSKLIFEKEVFKEYFVYNSIKSFDFNEKKKMIYTITNNNWLRCFDYSTNSFSIKHHFNSKDTPTMVCSCPNNNLFGVCFLSKFVVYSLFRDKILNFCEFEIVDPYAKFTDKGDYVAISGESRVNKNYCIYFIDTIYFNTVYVIENLPKIKKIDFLNNDNYIFALLDNSFILGWSIKLDLITISLMNRIKEHEKNVESYYFNLIFKHSAKSVEYDNYDYDFKNDLLLVSKKNINKICIFKKKNVLIGVMEMRHKIKTIKILKDLKCLLAGFDDGSLRIYRWPFKEEEKEKISKDNKAEKEGANYGYSSGIVYHENRQILCEINLHTKDLNNLLISKNLKNIVTTSNDGSIIISNLLIIADGLYKEYDPFNESGNKIVPNIEELVKISDVYEYKISDIKKKDQKVNDLENEIKLLQVEMQREKENKVNEYSSDIATLEMQKEESYTEEERKESVLRMELDNLRMNIEKELQNKIHDHEREKERLGTKYNEKLQLYKNEIERLNTELKSLRESIEEKFKSLINNQSQNFRDLYESYDTQYIQMKKKIEDRIKFLVKCSAEYDEGAETTIRHYRKMVEEMDTKIDKTIEKNQTDLKELKKISENEKNKENEYKSSLDQRVQESDKIILKNAEIKKYIIDTTQRTITFQEQLLETDKNLVKIANKLKDLDLKNKHLEQIRFVLEHRMTSLDKEKAPLEGQCTYLESQKNGLQDEFNKLILDINLKNQKLENKQSQLRACLIQNFEVNDQNLYLKKKLKHLQSEIKTFILTHQESEGKDGKISIKENKATFVALKLREFYEKFFGNNLEHELKNYQYFLNKLQEESEKLNVANNHDLIMRDLGEEKLIAERDKLEQIKIQKDKGFKRMQNDNTILIAECNRLRKNLHEIYMHVVDIEAKFEGLTKINPGLNKAEIVYQIKDFIKQTHNKIRNNFQDNEEDDQAYIPSEHKLLRNKDENKEIAITRREDFFSGDSVIKSANEYHEDIRKQNADIANIRYIIKNAFAPDEIDKEAYENFLRLPDISNNSSKREASFRSLISDKSKSKIELLKNESNLDLLPAIDDRHNSLN